MFRTVVVTTGFMIRLMPLSCPICVASSLLLCVASGVGCKTDDPPPLPVVAGDSRPILGSGDVIEVRVFGEDDLSGEHQVSSSGTIRLPLVGEMRVEGLTADDLTERIAAAYNAKYLKDAQVTVLVKKMISRQVFVLGQVKNPGPIPYEGRMTVIAAIARAGGITQLGDANRAVISREKEGKTKRMRASIADISRGNAPNVEVLPGDIIFVPESPY